MCRRNNNACIGLFTALFFVTGYIAVGEFDIEHQDFRLAADNQCFLTQRIEMLKVLDMLKTRKFPLKYKLLNSSMSEKFATYMSVRIEDYRPFLGNENMLEEIKVEYYKAK